MSRYISLILYTWWSWYIKNCLLTDGKCFIQTELVLITTDRNLRVKALARNLAVSALDEFLQWANDCRESTWASILSGNWDIVLTITK